VRNLPRSGPVMGRETGPVRALKLDHEAAGTAVEDCPCLERFPAAPCLIPRGGAPMETGNQFSRCLLDRKDEESRGARRLRRRTLFLAILIQALILTLLMLRPLFGAQEVPTMVRFVPLPPWKGQPGPPATLHHAANHHSRRGNIPPAHLLFYPPRLPAAHEQDSGGPPEVGLNPDASGGTSIGDPNGLIPGEGLLGPVRPSPPPPREPEQAPPKPRWVPPDIQQALLLVRVEPQYPVLAKQIYLEGTVQIRAIIARDGTVHSAEILSGHLLLARAARDAILQWRYRPTLLRGQPIEVETLVTARFKMQ
jgi:periplasmic protein TonB